MGVTSLFVLVVVTTCFLNCQVNSARDEHTCTQDYAKINIDLAQDIKYNRRDAYRKGCEESRKLVEECAKNHFSLTILKMGYEQNCLSAEAQKWLNSSGTMMQGGLLTGILTILTIILRFY